MAGSRREVFETHADRTRVARCPVCRSAVEQDHAEALRIELDFGRTLAADPAPAESEEPLVVGFALV